MSITLKKEPISIPGRRLLNLFPLLFSETEFVFTKELRWVDDDERFFIVKLPPHTVEVKGKKEYRKVRYLLYDATVFERQEVGRQGLVLGKGFLAHVLGRWTKDSARYFEKIIRQQLGGEKELGENVIVPGNVQTKDHKDDVFDDPFKPLQEQYEKSRDNESFPRKRRKNPFQRLKSFVLNR